MSDMRWTPVTERFPKEDQRVLVTIFGNIDIGYFDKDPDTRQLRFCAEEYELYEDELYEYVTAWMPLPEPYNP